MRRFTSFFVGLVALTINMLFSGQGMAQEEVRHSVLATGNWHKIAVTGDSIYRISFEFLSNMGIKPTQTDPRKISIFGNGGKMLPQANSADRPVDLIENSILVVGEDDGVFNTNDYILFYGQGPDTFTFDETNRTVAYENHDYSDTTYYFLTVSDTNGKRVGVLEDLGNGFPLVEDFLSVRVHEQDQHKLVISGREWYGEKFNGAAPQDFVFDFEGLISTKPAQLITSLLARTFSPAEFQVSVNGDQVGLLTMESVPNGTYSSRAKKNIRSFSLSQIIPSGNEITITLDYQKAASSVSIGYLDYLLVAVHRQLALYNDQTLFRSWESVDNEFNTYKIKNVTAGTYIWDITNPFSPSVQNYVLQGDEALFGAGSSGLKSYIVFDPERVKTPLYIGSIDNQDIRGMEPANLIIITHPTFYQEAQRLADLRRSYDGLTVTIVTPQMIYNEFSSGSQDVTAIRDYLKYVWDTDHTDTGIRYVLLFGKGSYDFKNRLKINSNFVPIYESRNSLHPIFSYSSDDYFGFMDEDEGVWNETSNGDHTLEIGIGRLPVKTIEEARIVVDKYYTYALDPGSFGPWRNTISFVADDQDNSLHQRQANMLTDTVKVKNSDLNIRKLYLDAFPQITLPGREAAPEANAFLDKIIDQGTLIMNFTGHGNENQWTHERILDFLMIDKWTNEFKLPLFITATCEFGRHDNPEKISGGERVILKEKGGAIALVTTARPVFASQNFELNNAFYQAAFKLYQGERPRLGDIFRETKNNSLSGSVNRNFSLLGDPSLKLAFPEGKIKLETINGAPFQDTDTLKALSKVFITGIVGNPDNEINTGFNGVAYIILFEKSTQKQTLGNKTPVYQYEERDNIIFNGKVTVTNGKFAVEFVMPKNIRYNYGLGKISMYAYSEALQSDASGSSENIVIGGSAENVLTDTTPPEIKVFLGDTTFIPGNLIKPNTVLLARIFDESGITISNSGLGQDIQAVLDNDSVFFLNEFYVADIDTYKSGWVVIPLNNLETGPHNITVKAWDTYNNPAEASVDFIVSEKDQLILKNLRNYPNPFTDFTQFTFEHNRPGEDLEIILHIYNSSGAVVKETKYTLYNSFAFASGIDWDGRNTSGEKLRPGIYYYRVDVRSMLDGASSRLFQKLIIY